MPRSPKGERPARRRARSLTIPKHAHGRHMLASRRRAGAVNAPRLSCLTFTIRLSHP